VAKRCPLCDFEAPAQTAWRTHLRTEHDWDPADEPTWVGDFLLAVVCGTLVFISLMMISIGAGPGRINPDVFATWTVIGVLAFPAGLLVLLIQPLRLIGERRRLAKRRAATAHPGHKARPRTSAAVRGRLRRIDAVTSALVFGASAGLGVAYTFRKSDGDNTLWLTTTVVCLLVIGVAALVRARVRRRMLT